MLCERRERRGRAVEGFLSFSMNIPRHGVRDDAQRCSAGMFGTDKGTSGEHLYFITTCCRCARVDLHSAKPTRGHYRGRAVFRSFRAELLSPQVRDIYNILILCICNITKVSPKFRNIFLRPVKCCTKLPRS